jgi:hypothetical protein
MIARTSKVICEVIAATLLGLLLLLAAAGWRLSQGPVSLTFLTEQLEAALNTGGGPLTVRLDGTQLAWAGWKRTLDLRIVGVRLLGRDGQALASVPEMAASFSVRALLQGVIAPTTLEILDAHVELVRGNDGAFLLALGDGEGGMSDDLLREIAATISAERDTARPLSFLRRVSVLDSRVDIADRMTGTMWGAPEADIVITREAAGLRIRVAAAIDLGGELVRVGGDAVWGGESKEITAEISFSGMQPERLALKLPALAQIAALRAPVSGDVTLALAPDGELRDAEFRLYGEKGVVDLPDFWPDGLPITRFAAHGYYRSGPDMLDVRSFEVDLGGPRLSGQGSAIRIGRTTAFDASAVLRDVAVKDLATYWPVPASEPTRAWILENIKEGVVSEARLRVAMHTDDLEGGQFGIDALNGTMAIRGASVNFLDGMPPIRNVDSTAAFTRDRFLFTFTSGDLEGIRLESGNARFTQLDADEELAVVEVVVRGRLADVLRLLDRPRFGFATELGLDPGIVDGESATRMVVSFPLKKDLPAEKVDFVAAANLRAVSVPDAVMGHALSGGRMTLRVDRKGMEIKGNARLGPVPAEIAWFENFGGGEPFSRRYEVTAVMDKAQRKAFDLPFAEDIEGPVAVDLALVEGTDGGGQMAVKLGLKDAVLELPALDWIKPKGKEAIAWLTIDTRKLEPVAIREFELTTPELRVRGGIDLPRDEEPLTARIERFSLGATDVSGTLVRRADGALDIELSGQGLDAAALIRHAFKDREGGREGAGMPPFAVNARLDRLWFGTGEPISDVAGMFRYDGETLRMLDFTGALDEAHRIQVNLDSSAKGRSFAFDSDNAGLALATVGLTENIRGGSLRIRATREETVAAPWRGQLTMNNWQLVKAPLLARMLTILSLTGINNLLTGEGIAFAALDMPFVYDQPALKITNARAVGSELGITGSGVIDTRQETWNIEGTLVPAYTINSILGNIPILGQLFTGDKGSGVFAATYRVQGPIDDPKVSVNPLAALAPGFLRNLLGIFDGGGRSRAGQSEPGASPE